MSGAPARGTTPRRQRRHHHHHQKHHKPSREEEQSSEEQSEEKRPKVNPIFLWASQREQRIVEVRCEDYDKRNRIKLTKTAQGWRSIPRTASNMYSTGLGVTFQKTGNATSPSNTSVTNDGKEIITEQTEEHVAIDLQHISAKELANGRTNNGLVATNAARKRSYDEINRNTEHRRNYGFPLDNLRNNVVGATWDEKRRRVPCSDDDDKEDDDEEDEEDDDEEDDEDEEDEAEEEPEIGRGRSKLERLQKDKLLQPRVMLEQLHFSQLPEGVHQSILQSQGNEKKGQQNEDDDDVIVAEKKEDCEKRLRMNKAGIQDILNMIDATASPVLATDTPSADLPVDSTKTCELENHLMKSSDSKIGDSSILLELSGEMNEQRTGVISSYHEEDKVDDNLADDKIEIHEEKILRDYDVEEEKTNDQQLKEDDVVIVSIKSNSNSKMCKVVEADDGGLEDRSKCRSNSRVKYQNMVSMYEEEDAAAEVEEERPDEPGDEPIKIDYNDSSKILKALRNTPGLSVSITRTNGSESSKSNNGAPSTRPASKASSSRSPDSQAECIERRNLLKNADSETQRTTTASSSKNLPGLSIIIPSYRYRNPQHATHSISPNMKARVESPESTVNFAKTDSYRDELKSDGFPHEEDHDEERDIEEEEEVEEDEDDCDSQVLEELRRQKADSLAYESDRDYFHRQGNPEDRKTPPENAKNQAHWISSSRNSEAQAKCKYQDVEHFDEQVLEELRTRGTVVSPQPSGIPCSPASRRPSSAYLERLLPSPPCSVSCSEDAKNDITLKGILSSPNQLETRDYEKQKENSNRCDQIPSEHHRVVRLDQPKEVERTNLRKRSRNFQDSRTSANSQEIRSSGRPLSSGDIHSTYYVADRGTIKRPMSAEWTNGKQRNQPSPYQKFTGKRRVHSLEEACATSSTTDKLLDPASQLRELIETSGHLIPEPLLVPRDYLPGLAAAPATEIPKLLASRPELRLPEALDRPDLVRDPDLLVISLAHLQHVLDHGEGPVSRSRSSHQRINNGTNKGSASNGARNVLQARPKLSCKPIGTLMPAPIDLSSSRRTSPYPPLLRVRSGLLKQEPEVSSTASSPDDSQLWHPLFGSHKRHHQQYQQQQQNRQQQYHHQQQQHRQNQRQSQHQSQLQHQYQDQQQNRNQNQHPHSQPHAHQHQHQHASWHRTTLAS